MVGTGMVEDTKTLVGLLEPFLLYENGRVRLAPGWRRGLSEAIDLARCEGSSSLLDKIVALSGVYEALVVMMRVEETQESFEKASFQEFFAFCQGLRKDLAEIQAEMGSDSSEIRKAHESLSGDTESWQGVANRTERKGPPDFLSLRAEQEKRKK
jgi:hypothetical protein